MAFSWGEFSEKAIESITGDHRRINIWDGAVRSGKTVCSVVAWLRFIISAPPGLLLMAGKTERTLKRNILDPIASIIGDKFQISPSAGEAVIFGRAICLVGANDQRAEGKLRGATLAGAYGDEITLWDESFFKMLLSRLSLENAKFFGTTNPDSRYHWLLTDYLQNDGIDIARHQFTLDDNLNLPKSYKEIGRAHV